MHGLELVLRVVVDRHVQLRPQHVDLFLPVSEYYRGFTSQIVSIWFLGGLITLILGILGIYLANIMAETKRRPYTIVRRIHRANTVASSAPNVIKVHGARPDTGAQR